MVSDFSTMNALRMLALILISSNFVGARLRLLRIDASLAARQNAQSHMPERWLTVEILFQCTPHWC